MIHATSLGAVTNPKFTKTDLQKIKYILDLLILKVHYSKSYESMVFLVIEDLAEVMCYLGKEQKAVNLQKIKSVICEIAEGAIRYGDEKLGEKYLITCAEIKL